MLYAAIPTFHMVKNIIPFTFPFISVISQVFKAEKKEQ